MMLVTCQMRYLGASVEKNQPDVPYVCPTAGPKTTDKSTVSAAQRIVVQTITSCRVIRRCTIQETEEVGSKPDKNAAPNIEPLNEGQEM